MELLNKNENEENSQKKTKTLKNRNYIEFGIVGLVVVFVFTQVFDISINPRFKSLIGKERGISQKKSDSDLEMAVLPAQGVVLPIVWGDLGKQMIDKGVIDKNKFEALNKRRGGLTKNEMRLLYSDKNGNVKMTKENAGFLLNLFWAVGLSNKNDILEKGPMVDPRYGGAERFASTGGWTMASGNVMNHYSAHKFISLTKKQQKLVKEVSKNIYRPCCGNPTYFPDCNHGMAMLGFLELMASNGVSENEMYKMALSVNSYWFPGNYMMIAKYFDKRGVDWNDVDAKEVLGDLYSSASGYKEIKSSITPTKQTNSGSGCGV